MLLYCYTYLFSLFSYIFKNNIENNINKIVKIY
jgi:hypothetical protein